MQKSPWLIHSRGHWIRSSQRTGPHICIFQQIPNWKKYPIHRKWNWALSKLHSCRTWAMGTFQWIYFMSHTLCARVWRWRNVTRQRQKIEKLSSQVDSRTQMKLNSHQSFERSKKLRPNLHRKNHWPINNAPKPQPAYLECECDYASVTSWSNERASVCACLNRTKCDYSLSPVSYCCRILCALCAESERKFRPKMAICDHFRSMNKLFHFQFFAWDCIKWLMKRSFLFLFPRFRFRPE